MNAIGLIELNSVARGIEVWDSMLKTASVELLTATTLCPGKYMVLISGDVGSVETSIDTGRKTADSWLVDSLIIPNIHPAILSGITGSGLSGELKALGLIETFSVASGIIFADTALKAASVDLIEFRIAMGLGGKATIYLTGDVGPVEASIEAGKKSVPSDMIADISIIPSPHKELNSLLD